MKNLLPKRLWSVLAVVLVVRIVLIVATFDAENDYYWEYGELAKNVLAGRGYSLFSITTDTLQHRFNPEVEPFPSAFMPPGYVAVLLPIIAIKDTLVANIVFATFQLIISLLSIVLLYRFTAVWGSHESALAAAWIAALLPDNAYATVSRTPIILYQCAILIFFILMSHPIRNSVAVRSTMGALTAAATCYLRFDFLLFFFVIMAIIWFEGQRKRALLTAAFTLLLLSPWPVRNYLTFGEPVWITTNVGLNLFRGNNELEIGAWANDHIMSAIPTLPRTGRFELSLDSLYRSEARKQILAHPWAQAWIGIRKLAHLWIYSPIQQREGLALTVPFTLVVLALFIVGGMKKRTWRDFRLPGVFLLCSTVIGFVFFSLPRHHTIMLIAVLPYAGVGARVLIGTFRHREEG
jgi:hypothetical protein